MKRFLILCGLFGLAAPLMAQDKTCMTDPELMAEVAARYLVEQEYRAVVCAYLYKDTVEPAPGMLLALVRDVARKFQMQFADYHKLRQERFQRLFGDKWEQALRQDHWNKLRFLNADPPEMPPETCEKVKKEWESMLFRDWLFVRRHLDVMIEELRPTVRMCPLPKREVEPLEELEDLIEEGDLETIR